MNQLLEETKSFARSIHDQMDASHDFNHITRVFQLAQFIQSKEGGNLLVIQLASLLHDIGDYKYHNGNEQIGAKLAKEFLTSQQVPLDTIDQVVYIINNIGFKGGHFEQSLNLELSICRDADKLDAIGAIGIARTFHFGGMKNHELFNENIPYREQLTKAEYINEKSTTVNHFHEKLLKLKDLMETNTGKELALERHNYMADFLKRFENEWFLQDFIPNKAN